MATYIQSSITSALFAGAFFSGWYLSMDTLVRLLFVMAAVPSIVVGSVACSYLLGEEKYNLFRYLMPQEERQEEQDNEEFFQNMLKVASSIINNTDQRLKEKEHEE